MKLFGTVTRLANKSCHATGSYPMANFKVHALTAFTASVSAASYVTVLNDFPLPWGGLLCVLGVIGGLLPDVDSGESKMARYCGILAGACLSIVTYVLSQSYIISFLAFTPLAKVTNLGIKKWTTHRGVFHSIPMGLLLSIAVFVLADLLQFPHLFSIFCTGFLGGGYLIHLVLDEIWSLRHGITTHCSFGTALQVFRLTFWKSFLATYALLACAIYSTPFFKSLVFTSLSSFWTIE